LENARVIARLSSWLPPISFEKPMERCCCSTPGARMLNRTSLSGIG
jgi:hypothetical protein